MRVRTWGVGNTIKCSAVSTVQQGSHLITIHRTTLHHTALNYTLSLYTTIHHTSSHYTTLHYTTLNHTSSYHTTCINPPISSGYKVLGSNTLSCSAGSWNSSIPLCALDVLCPELTAPYAGTLSSLSTEYGTQVDI